MAARWGSRGQGEGQFLRQSQPPFAMAALPASHEPSWQPYSYHHKKLHLWHTLYGFAHLAPWRKILAIAVLTQSQSQSHRPVFKHEFNRTTTLRIWQALISAAWTWHRLRATPRASKAQHQRASTTAPIQTLLLKHLHPRIPY